jgi:hypothetical protein
MLAASWLRRSSRLVPRRNRHLDAVVRLLQSELRTGARYPGRARQQDRPGLRSGSADAFRPRRQWGAFAVRIAKDVEQRLLAEKKTVTWTLRVNSRPSRFQPISALPMPSTPSRADRGVSPVLRFDGALKRGHRAAGRKTSIKAVVGTPVTVKFSVTDDKRLAPKAQPRCAAGLGALSRRGCRHHYRSHQVRRRQRRQASPPRSRHPVITYCASKRSIRKSMTFIAVGAMATFAPPSRRVDRDDPAWTGRGEVRVILGVRSERPVRVEGTHHE